MNAQLFIVFFGLAGAALAFWTDVRFPKLAPEAVRTLLFHLLAASLIPKLAFAARHALFDDGSAVAALVSILFLALPSLVYIMLVAIWGIRLAQRALYRGAV